MAIIKKMPSLAIIDGLKGTIDYYVYMGVPCARRWPRSPGHRRTPEVEAQWAVFKEAAALWPQISPEVRQAYAEMAVTTDLTARDMLTRGYISGTLRYYQPVDELPEIAD
ncbi:hypothetical protein ES708_30977 [subsurface metagenome]